MMGGRSFEEAILWHGGEAAASKEAFRSMAAADRAAPHQIFEITVNPVKTNSITLVLCPIHSERNVVKKNVAIIAVLLLAGLANAAVTNLFPNGNFDSSAGANWAEVLAAATTYSYPTSGVIPVVMGS